MDLSVIIRCGDDERVFQCIDSIDEDVEVVVSISENKELQNRLEDMGINYSLSPRKNLSKTSNIGFSEASHERVIITDSDTFFEKGCISKLFRALETFKVARAGIRFLVNPDIPFSRVVSEARDYVYYLPLVFTPGIAVRKDILVDIGGFLFNDPVPYAVDADLDYRIKKAGLPVAWLMNEAIIYHSAVTLRHDLMVAYRIGRGCRISIEQLRKYQLYNSIRWNDLKAVKTRHLPDLIRKKRLSVGFYQLLWDLWYWIGYSYHV